MSAELIQRIADIENFLGSDFKNFKEEKAVADREIPEELEEFKKNKKAKNKKGNE